MKTKPLHVTIEDSFLGPWRARIDNRTVTDGWITVRVTSRNHTHYRPGEIVTVRGEQVWQRHTFRKYRTLYQGKPELHWKVTA
jgi:hypothetical protein